ncbi:MAG TPA: hypothetical protein VK421_09355 [Pyrinomonadaceae bacterium]|nr:hypothetical protein [Pyrinomonadaceae bacterium]
MEDAARILVAVCYTVIGVSHLVRPREWAEFFIKLRELGAVGAFVVAFVHFPLGAIIVSLHNVWMWPEVVLTVCGWGLVVKGLLYFVWPAHGEKMLSRVTPDRAGEFRLVSPFAFALSAFSIYLVLRGG